MRTAWACLFGAGSFACSWLVPSASDLTGGGSDSVGGPEASTGDGGDGGDGGAIVDVVGAATSDGESGAPPVLFAWTFDLGCSGWTPYRSVLATETALPLSPPAACKICASGGANDDFGMSALVPDGLPTDEVLTVEARARAEADGGAMTLKVTLYTSANDGMSGTNQVGETYGVAATAKRTPAMTSVYIKGASPRTSPCLIVDDVTLRR